MPNTQQGGSTTAAARLTGLRKGTSVTLGALTNTVTYGFSLPGVTIPNLATTTGFTIAAGGSVSVPITQDCDLWYLSASGTAQIIVQDKN